MSNEEIKQALESKRGQPEDQLHCSACGEGNPSNAIFCNDCGADLHPEFGMVREGIKLLGLSPAESMYLSDQQTDINEMINVTFLDMLNRDVLEITSREVTKGLLIKKEQLEMFVQGGSALNDVLKPHEEAFQEALDKPELILDKYIKNLIKKLGRFTWHRKGTKYKWNFPRYRDKIRDQMEDIGYIEKYKTKSMGLIPKSHYKLTDYGEEKRNKIESLLLEIDEYNEDHPQNNFPRALVTRMFLLNNDDEVKVKKFSRTLSGELTSRIQRK